MKDLLKDKKFQMLLGVAALVLITEVLGIFNIHLPIFIEIPFFVIVIILVGKKVLLNGLKSLTKLDFSDINLLMTIAIIGAVIIGEFEEAAVIVALFAVSEQLEDLGTEKSQSAINELIEKTPKQIYLVSGELVSVDDVKVGSEYMVKPGEIIGLDGIVVSGHSAVDEASITGESLPKEKIQDNLVFAGTLNISGSLTIKVTKGIKDSAIQKIVNLTSHALANKASYQKFIEKFAKIYTPAVLVGAILLTVVPSVITGNFLDWFTRGITLLLIACPCALVISTPISVFSAVGNASKKGILIKGGKFLEAIGSVNAIAFDKTRTLTYGKPMIDRIYTFHNTTEEEVISCAAGLEKYSEHPLAHAVIEYAKDKKLKLHEYTKFSSIPGKGIKGDCVICNVGEHVLGNIQMLIDNQTILNEDVREIIREVQYSGKTPIILADHEGVKGIIVVADEIKPHSARLIDELRKLKITSVMLTGDNSRTAATVANLINVNESHGDLLPEDKVKKLQEIRSKYGTIAMVGDGVNDAPSLALADVGIAMGAAGSDVAIESADIALMNDKIELLPYLIRLGNSTGNTIRFNIVLAFITKAIALLLTVTGRIDLAGAIFADVGVTIIVILNSLRLINYK